MDNEPIQPERKKRGRKPVDLRGMRYGKLIPIEMLPREPGKQTMWKCICIGDHVPALNLKRECEVAYSALVGGKRRSCGCQRWRRTYRASGERELFAYATRNDLVSRGIPAPDWMLTKEQADADTEHMAYLSRLEANLKLVEEYDPFADDTN